MSALLLLTKASNLVSKNIESIIKIVPEITNKTLYIYLQIQNVGNKPPLQLNMLQRLVSTFYCNELNSTVDCRVYLTNIKNLRDKYIGNLEDKKLHFVISDGDISEETICKDIIQSAAINANTKFYDIKCEENANFFSNPGQSLDCFNYTVLGGTFDRLHAGHKVLLSEAVMLTTKRLTVGVTDNTMAAGKQLKELLQPLEQRIEAVKEFLTDIDPSIEYDIVPISDSFGPSIVDPDLQCIIVSDETLRGGQKVNEERLKRNLAELEIHSVSLVPSDSVDQKMSSTEKRKCDLGKIIKFPSKRVSELNSPYIIGLTGGIASGKSSIAKRLANLGAVVIDCDRLGHQSYQKGTSSFQKIVQYFGPEVVGDATGEINRRELGSIVFSDKEKLKKLNGIVWPEIGDRVKKKLASLKCKTGVISSDIVIVDAAVLIESGWDKFVDQIWTCIISETEAVKRVMDRNKLSETAARQRIKEQMSDSERVSHSNLLFCSLWEPSETQKQVERAWTELSAYLSAIRAS